MTTLIIIGSILATIIIGLLIFMFTIKFDESHNAASKALHARIYRFLSATTTLPNNICSYFWNYLLVILTLPFTFPLLIINKIKNLKIKNHATAVSISLVCELMLISLTAIIYAISVGKISWLNVLIFIGTAIGITIAMVGVAIGTIALSNYIASKLIKVKKVKLIKEPTELLLIKRFKDWKNNNCSIINWDNN